MSAKRCHSTAGEAANSLVGVLEAAAAGGALNNLNDGDVRAPAPMAKLKVVGFEMRRPDGRHWQSVAIVTSNRGGPAPRHRPDRPSLADPRSRSARRVVSLSIPRTSRLRCHFLRMLHAMGPLVIPQICSHHPIRETGMVLQPAA